MQVDGHPQLRRPPQDGVEPELVEEPVPGPAVDHGSDEPELTDGAVELVGGGVRHGSRQRGEGGEAVRVRRDGRRRAVVDLPDELHGDVGGQLRG